MNRSRLALALLLGALLAGPPAAPAQDGGGIGGGRLGGDPPRYPNDPEKPLAERVNQAIDSGINFLMGKNAVGEKVFTSVAGNWSDAVTSDHLYDPNSKGDPYVHPTGCTSLALYALLKSGVSRDDPVVKKAFQWLRGGSASITKGKTSAGKAASNRIPAGTYEIATLVLALEAKANPHKMERDRERDLKFRLKKGEQLKLDVKLEPEDEAWMKDLVAALKQRLVGGVAWRYGFNTGAGWYNGVRGDKDLSASNLSMLAMAAAERCGFRQDDAFYAGVLKWTLSMQEKEGPEVKRWDPMLKEEDKVYGVGKDQARGFGYLGTSGADGEQKASASMTCCGLANIVICTSFLDARQSPLYTGELAQAAEKGWWDGVAWLDYWWSVDHNANGAQGYHYYYLYCLERACDLKRVNLIAGHPWYELGAQVLVDDQNSGAGGDAKFLYSGGWAKQDTHRPSDLLNTCFALLFLNRATPAITGRD